MRFAPAALEEARHVDEIEELRKASIVAAEHAAGFDVRVGEAVQEGIRRIPAQQLPDVGERGPAYANSQSSTSTRAAGGAMRFETLKSPCTRHGAPATSRIEGASALERARIPTPTGRDSNSVRA